ncbi:MAG: DNA polymerase [Planctomycetota bacterium]
MPLNVLFVDMNAYFASVEQQYRPELRGRPVAVVPVKADTTCCIAASYEARPFGVKTGTLVGDAKKMCPGIVLIEANHELYVRTHHAIVAAVETCLPVHRVHSIDEMSCRLSSPDQSPERALRKGMDVKEAVRRRVGEHLKCSVGIAPNTFLAKVASDMKKPNGLTTIAAEDLPHKLHSLALMDFPGIGPRMNVRLQRQGVETVEQLCAFSPDELERLWGGIVGKRFWLALHGHDVPDLPTRRRTVGHSHVLPPELRTEAGAQGVLVRLLCKAAARMRRLGYWASRLDAYISYRHGGVWHSGVNLNGCQDTSSLVNAFITLWVGRSRQSRSPVQEGEHESHARRFPGWPVTQLPKDRNAPTRSRQSPVAQPFKVGVVLSNLLPTQSVTQPLFVGEQRSLSLSRMMDRINSRYGRDAVHVGTVHQFLESAPTRIAFSNVPDIDDPANWDDNEDNLEHLVSSWRSDPPPPVSVYDPWTAD